MNIKISVAVIVCAVFVFNTLSFAQGVQDTDPFHVTVQVTATRFGEPIQEVPGAITVVTGNEIRTRGATDLRTALALLGGVSVAPGGDAGPAGAVPGLIGVREVDDLLLLIDGIPAGDRKSTRLNSSHLGISYAVFCLKKKKKY